jgi:hypothetical protein
MSLFSKIFGKEQSETVEELSADEMYGGTVEMSQAQVNRNVVDSEGALLEQNQAEELEEDPEVIETDNGEVVSLCSFKDDESVLSEAELMDVSPREIEQYDSFFTEQEKEILLDKERRFSEEELAASNRVSMALRSDEFSATDIDSLWRELCKLEGKHGLSEEEELTEAEAEQKMLERLDTDIEPEHIENKKMKDMTGSELKQVFSEANTEPQSEELQDTEDTEDIEVEELGSVDRDTGKIASVAFENYAKESGSSVWSELSKEIEAESNAPDNTRVYTENNQAILETSNEELIAELQKDAKSNPDLELISRNSDIARFAVSDISKYQ